MIALHYIRKLFIVV